MNSIEINKIIVQLVGKLIDNPLSSGYDVILNTLRDERPNLMDVLESRLHSY
jgi:hypothetical protein